MVKYTWDWTKGTSDIIITHTRNIEFGNSSANGTLKITAFMDAPTTTTATTTTVSTPIDIKTTPKQKNESQINPENNKIIPQSSAIANRNSYLGIALSVFFSIFLFYPPIINRYSTIGLIFLFTVSLAYSTNVDGNYDEPHIHLKVPIEYVEKICVEEEECFPVKCTLSLGSTFSTFPSNNKILFNGKFCELKRPKLWLEWVQHYFRINVKTEQYYLRDNDNDGLVNFIEYYGGVDFFNITVNGEQELENKTLSELIKEGTDPTNPDSDGDLLLDGFEYSNGMPPKSADNRSADADSDGLTNLREQILGTNPTNPDTDGDGVNDGTEVANNADPKDPSDQGLPIRNQSFAMIKLTIGDHSGSHSERYFMTVGPFKHQSPDYGKVGSGVYKYLPGTYSITITHIDSNLPSPDYDYQAEIEKQSGDATIQVKDPQRILGFHGESNYDFTLGKSATLIVTSKKGSPGECSTFKTCEACHKNVICEWRKALKSCIKKPISRVNDPDYSRETCACSKCLTWYKNENKDTRWLRRVNQEFKCPCKARVTNAAVKEIDNPSWKLWYPDPTCTNIKSEGCTKYHPGSSGCILSELITNDKAGQQCCYNSTGHLLAAGTRGAGTPDKQYPGPSNWYNHFLTDIVPFNNCCQYCEIDSYCNYFIDGVRKGNSSHCPQ